MRFVIVKLFTIVFAVVSSVIAGPPHPDVVEKMRQEGTLDEYKELLRSVAERGAYQSSEESRAATRSLTTQKAAFDYNVLCILVDFSDNQAIDGKIAGTPSMFETRLFSTGQVSTGSLKEYFEEISYGDMNIMGTVVGWYRMPEPFSFYTNGESGYGLYPNNSQSLAEHAFATADADGVDFSQFDNDGDGIVDGVMIVTPGIRAQMTGDPWGLSSVTWTTPSIQWYDGVGVNRYSIQSEESPYTVDISEIGVFCLQLGYHLGMDYMWDPDFFDQSGLGYWSLMAWGFFNNNERSPAHPDPYNRYRVGFSAVRQIVCNAYGIDLPPVEIDPGFSTSNAICKLTSDALSWDEYFLVEHRAMIGFDAYLPGEGLLIYHVDESMSNNEHEWIEGVTPFGDPHYLVALEQADGEFDLEYGNNRGDSEDPFNDPFALLNGSSIPSSRGYNGQRTGIVVSNITEVEGIIYADLETAAPSPTPLIVDNLTDATTPVPYGSLRWAITEANANPGADRIEFHPALAGTIFLVSDLPAITGDGTVIDGSTALGGNFGITLDGTNATGNGLEILSECNDISGLVIINFPGSGISIQSRNNSIHDNYVGVMNDGITPAPNDTGISVHDEFNQIGTDGGNIISGNAVYGIYCEGIYDGYILNNFIGLSADGYQAVPNGDIGIKLRDVSDVGIWFNVISGNTKGVQLYESRARIWGNKIGTDVTGYAPLDVYTHAGIDISYHSTAYIGGLPDHEVKRNIISGNANAGIAKGHSQSDAIVVGNYIGVGPDGVTPVPNGRGIYMYGAPYSVGVIIGGTSEEESNVIAHNNHLGVYADRANDFLVTGNQIFSNGLGSHSLVPPSDGAGVLLLDSENGTVTGNVITENVTGIEVTCPGGDPSICDDNYFADNIIYGNGDVTHLDIDINDGANNGIPTPIINNVTTMGGDLYIVSGIEGPPSGEVNIYLASESQGLNGEHPSGSGGSIYDYPLATASCNIYGSWSVSGVPLNYHSKHYDIITAMGIDGSHTSEFSINRHITTGMITGLCPIDLVVRDPQGDSIGVTFNSMSCAIYDNETDINYDGDPDDFIYICFLVAGDYEITVFPEPEARATDTYTLLFVNGLDSTYLAIDESVPAPGDSTVYSYEVSSGCCDIPGDADDNGSVDISDLTYYVAYMFGGGDTPVCMEEFDNDGNCSGDISDLTYFVSYMFGGGSAPVDCHSCP